MTKTKKQGNSGTLALFLKIMLILITSALICITTYYVYLTKKAESAANDAYEELGDRQYSEKREEKVKPIEDNVSVLFIGIDDSEKRGQGSEESRSDALVLATLNNKEKSVKLLSIPRDSYVYIPEMGKKDKITHAHAAGGALATIETVEELFDIPIDYYVRMNFNAFIDVVDALGGIEAEVPYALQELDENDKRTVNLQPGLQQLNGREALALARTRKQDSDIQRGLRQQEILKAIALKTASVSSLTKYDDIIEAVGNNMKTNMTFDEMKSFFYYVSKGVPQVESLQLLGYDDWTYGYYYMLDEPALEETKAILQGHLDLIPDPVNLTETDSNTTETENQTN